MTSGTTFTTTRVEAGNPAYMLWQLERGLGDHQHLREAIENMRTHAQATLGEVTVEPQAVKTVNAYRRLYLDNGYGMTPEQLHSMREVFQTTGEHDRHGHANHGVGIRLATFAWNPNGVVFVSKRDGETWATRLGRDEHDDPALVPDDSGRAVWRVSTGESWAGCDWSRIIPDEWDSGTGVVLLGSDHHPDTILGDPRRAEGANGGTVGVRYLNERYLDLTDGPTITVRFPRRAASKATWGDPTDTAGYRDGKGYWDSAVVRGLRPFLEGQEDLQLGEFIMADGTLVQWYLARESMAQDRMRQPRPGIYVAYQGECYERRTDPAERKRCMRAMGVSVREVQDRLYLILTPPLWDGSEKFGVTTDTTRSRLEVGVPESQEGNTLPWRRWNQSVAANLPEPIVDALRAHRSAVGDDQRLNAAVQTALAPRRKVEDITKIDRDQRERDLGGPSDAGKAAADGEDTTDPTGGEGRQQEDGDHGGAGSGAGGGGAGGNGSAGDDNVVGVLGEGDTPAKARRRHLKRKQASDRDSKAKRLRADKWVSELVEANELADPWCPVSVTSRPHPDGGQERLVQVNRDHPAWTDGWATVTEAPEWHTWEHDEAEAALREQFAIRAALAFVGHRLADYGELRERLDADRLSGEWNEAIQRLQDDEHLAAAVNGQGTFIGAEAVQAIKVARKAA